MKCELVDAIVISYFHKTNDTIESVASPYVVQQQAKCDDATARKFVGIWNGDWSRPCMEHYCWPFGEYACNCATREDSINLMLSAAEEVAISHHGLMNCNTFETFACVG